MITITKEHELYPPMLKDGKWIQEDGPETLYSAGNSSLLSSHCLSIVGSRKATPKGVKTAYNIAAHFASKGYTIVSGMAPGIDSAAHEGALSVGGKTIAVLASSLKKQDIRNVSLAEKIIKGKGLLISEYSEGRGDGPRYLARDRIIAALGIVCIPVQAEMPSGTLATVNRACNYNRALWVPLPLTSEKDHPSYAGIWGLIRNNSLNILKGKEDYTRMENHLKQLIEQ